MHQACSYFLKAFYLDLRSLALLRIGMGLVIIYNLYCLWPFINDFFGAEGVIPLKHHYVQNRQYFNWSLHALSDNYYFVVVLFIIQACFALMLIVGYRTRLAVIASWILAISLQHRMYLIAFGGDKALNAFLMWSVFLPLGAAFSLDNLRNKNNQLQPQQIISFATIGFICQIFIIYYASGWSKTHAAWVKDFTAVQLTLSAHDYAKPFGLWLAQFPWACKSLTVATLFLERFGIFLLFCPFGVPAWRIMLIISFVIFHLCIHFTLNLGWFEFIMIAAWLALLPSSVWCQPHADGTKNIYIDLRKRLGNIVALVLIVFVIFWNIFSLNNFNSHKRSKTQGMIGYLRPLALDQQWMFFDAPLTSVREYYFSPIFENPEDIKLGKMGYYEFKQQYQFKVNEDKRWRRFIYVLKNKSNREFVPYLSEYLARYWNRQFPDGPKVKSAKIIVWETDIELDKK